MMVWDDLFDPHDPHCINFEMQKWLSRGGRYSITISKKYNNQLHGSNSLREYMVWGWCTHLGMEELVSPAIPNYCNKKGGTAVPALVALDGLTSSEGIPKHKPFTHNNSMGSTGVWHRLRMCMDHLFDPWIDIPGVLLIIVMTCIITPQGIAFI